MNDCRHPWHSKVEVEVEVEVEVDDEDLQCPGCGELWGLGDRKEQYRRDLAAEDDNRRLLFFVLGEDEILGLLRAQVDNYQCLQICSADLFGPPPGSQVLSVHGECASRSMRILVTHPSFESVPVGQAIPVTNEVAVMGYKRQVLCLWPDGSYSTKPPPSVTTTVAREPGALVDGMELSPPKGEDVPYRHYGPSIPVLVPVGVVDDSFWPDLPEDKLQGIVNRVKEIRYDRLNSPAKV